VERDLPVNFRDALFRASEIALRLGFYLRFRGFLASRHGKLFLSAP
jgi:hypothetical protein